MLCACGTDGTSDGVQHRCMFVKVGPHAQDMSV